MTTRKGRTLFLWVKYRHLEDEDVSLHHGECQYVSRDIHAAYVECSHRWYENSRITDSATENISLNLPDRWIAGLGEDILTHGHDLFSFVLILSFHLNKTLFSRALKKHDKILERSISLYPLLWNRCIHSSYFLDVLLLNSSDITRFLQDFERQNEMTGIHTSFPPGMLFSQCALKTAQIIYLVPPTGVFLICCTKASKYFSAASANTKW